jgi:hypothetical protein
VEKEKTDLFKFKITVRIVPAGKPAMVFPHGDRAVPESYQFDPYFLKLVKAGAITKADPPPRPRKELSPEKQGESLLKKINESREKARLKEKAEAEAAAEAEFGGKIEKKKKG